jgi:3-hydroxyisobutyrate dehydrogenase-like beta-hydroxyacid dehydrogenase
MTPVVAVIAPGAMGSAVARRLCDNGVRVVTVLEGRSAESVKRAREAGMAPVGRSELAQAGIFLSIVPPGEAIRLAVKISSALTGSPVRPLYVDCNAINPETAARVADIVRNAGIDYVDAGIIGGPPKHGYDGPAFYLSGERAGDAAILSDFGLECRVLNGGAFAASALKMSYAGITKGLTALASMMILGASGAGVAEDLRAELLHSQPMMLAWFERQIPSMFSKAYRWVAEMEEIASFVRAQPEAEDLFTAAAQFYSRLSQQAGVRDVETLSQFFVQER